MAIRDRVLKYLLFATTILGACPALVAADTSTENAGADAITSVDHQSFGLRQGHFLGAPIPVVSPTLGAGLAVVGGYLFKFDEKSDSSFLGVGGFYTDNKSYGYGVAGKLNFREDSWKINFFLGDMRLDYNLAVGDALIPVTQSSPIVRVGVQYEFAKSLYIGVRGTYLESEITRSSGTGGLPPQLAPDAEVAIALGELTFQADTMDDSNYPTMGHDIFVSLGYGDRVKGGSGSFIKSFTNIDYYFTAGRGVIAAEVTLCNAGSGTPFFLLCSIGGTDSLRGFSSTEYMGQSLASVQAEYRGRFSERFGYAAFLGGGVLQDPISSFASGLNYSYGVGIRYRVSKAFKVDFSIDVSRNNHAKSQLQVYLGQRF